MDEGNWLQEATCAAYVRQAGLAHTALFLDQSALLVVAHGCPILTFPASLAGKTPTQDTKLCTSFFE